MTKRHTRQYEMLVRVVEFGAAAADKFPDGSAGQKAFAKVAAAVAQFEAASKTRALMREGGASAKANARESMLAWIITIVKTARAIAEETPGADSKFQPPVQLSDVAVLTVARAFLDELTLAKSAFVQHGLPETFVDDMQRATDSFAQAISSRSAGKVGMTEAQASLSAAVRQGLKAARLLDVIVPNVYGADSPVMEKWQRVRHVVTTAVAAAPAQPETEPPVQPPVAVEPAA